MNWNIEAFYQKDFSSDLEQIRGRKSWKELLGGCCLDEALRGDSNSRGRSLFLFCGAPGVGKTTLAEALAGEMASRGYRILDLDSTDLLGKNGKEAFARIDVLLNELHSGEKTFLLLRSFERIATKDKACTSLAAGLERVANRKFPVMAAAIAQELPYGRPGSRSRAPRPDFAGPPLGVCSGKMEAAKNWLRLCRLFTVFHVEAPDAVERETFFRLTLEPVFQGRMSLTFSQMAERTDGFTYAELQTVALCCKAIAAQRYRDSQYASVPTGADGPYLTEDIFEFAWEQANLAREMIPEEPPGMDELPGRAALPGQGEPSDRSAAGKVAETPSLGNASPMLSSAVAGAIKLPADTSQEVSYDIGLDDIFSGDSFMNPDNL